MKSRITFGSTSLAKSFLLALFVIFVVCVSLLAILTAGNQDIRGRAANGPYPTPSYTCGTAGGYCTPATGECGVDTQRGDLTCSGGWVCCVPPVGYCQYICVSDWTLCNKIGGTQVSSETCANNYLCCKYPPSPTPTPTPVLCSASMIASCYGWGADGCVVPKGGIETCTINGLYYYNQQDLRWRNTPLTCANNTTTYFVQNGCGEVAVSMLLSRYISPSYNPPVVLRSLFNNYCGPTKYDDDIQILQNNNFTVSYIDNTMNSLKQYIPYRPGWTAFILLDIDGKEHFTLASRISSTGHVLFDDPWYGAGVDYSGHTIDFKNIAIVTHK